MGFKKMFKFQQSRQQSHGGTRESACKGHSIFRLDHNQKTIACPCFISGNFHDQTFQKTANCIRKMKHLSSCINGIQV